MLREKFRFNGQSVVLPWFLSYVIILLLPITIGILLYFESSKTLEEEIHQANDSLLKQVREVMDNQFKAMEQLNIEITWNVRVQELLYSGKYLTYPKEYTYDVYQVARDLKQYQTAYPLVDSFYIYLAGDHSVVLPSTVRSENFAYETLHQTPSFPYMRWTSIVRRSNFKGFIPMYRIDDDGSLQKTVAYISTYPGEKDKAVATNVLMIDQSRILGAIQNMEIFNEGHVLILNEDNDILVSNANRSLPKDFPYEKMAGSSNFFYTDSEGEKFEVLYIQSPGSKLKYVSIIPSSLYWKKAEHVRNLTYLSMLISLLGGVILTLVFLRKNYHPVQRLVQAFARKPVFASEKRYNEFHFIQEAVDRTLSEVDRIKARMEQQRYIIRSNFIARLLKGKLDSQVPVDEALTAFHMNFETDRFAVLLLVIEESEAFFERTPSMQEGDKWKLLHFIIGNVVEELVSQKHRGYVAEIDETLACLINLSGEAEQEDRDDLLLIAREAQSFLGAKYDIQLTISISSVHPRLAGIAHAWQEALDAMEYKLVMGRNEILSYDQLQAERTVDADAGTYYPLQTEQQLMSYVKLGEFEKAKALVSDIIEKNVSRPVISVPLAKCFMLDLVSTLIKTTSESGSVQESDLGRNPKALERLISSQTIQDMQQQLIDILHEVCSRNLVKRQEQLQLNRQRALQGLMEEVMAFIEKNYNDVNLNVSMIGSHFERKATYLSKLFKDFTGEGLLDYINKVRVGKAKELMTATSKSVSDAASCVGFNDVNAFIRCFKKIEGITPGKYKEMLDQ